MFGKYVSMIIYKKDEIYSHRGLEGVLHYIADIVDEFGSTKDFSYNQNRKF